MTEKSLAGGGEGSMGRVSLIKRLKAFTGYRGRKARQRLFNELVNEGYHPSEIVSALECLGEDGPILLAGGDDARYRFLSDEEQPLLTTPAQARLVRMQKLGLIDAFQADMIMTIIVQNGIPRAGLKKLNQIITHVCDSGEQLIKLDTKRREAVLN